MNNVTGNKTLSTWLLGCCALIFAVVIVGAITRLTGSGLSITEWNVVIGTLPPFSHAAWERAFDLYKQSPQFQKENFWMTLQDFQTIFFWEWLHRLLARLVGLAYIIPLAWFWIKNKIPPGYKAKFLALVLLLLLQGAVGWFMVASGLIDRPSVSHYRLALHLSLAFLLYVLTLWCALTLPLSLGEREATPETLRVRGMYIHTIIVIALFILTFIWGAFTAGLDAGLIYNDTFPKMGAHWVPEEITGASSPLLAMLETPAGVQFVHRWLAIITALAMLTLWLHAHTKNRLFRALHGLALMAFLQPALGLATLLSRVSLPLAVMHQASALLILTLLIVILRKLKPD